MYCDAGQLVPCCVDHQRLASREGDAELKPRLVQEALAEQPGQLRVTELLTLRGAGGQPSKVDSELAADLAIHPDHRRDDGESVRLVRILGELAALSIQDVLVPGTPGCEGSNPGPCRAAWLDNLSKTLLDDRRNTKLRRR